MKLDETLLKQVHRWHCWNCNSHRKVDALGIHDPAQVQWPTWSDGKSLTHPTHVYWELFLSSLQGHNYEWDRQGLCSFGNYNLNWEVGQQVHKVRKRNEGDHFWCICDGEIKTVWYDGEHFFRLSDQRRLSEVRQQETVWWPSGLSWQLSLDSLKESGTT